MLKRYAAIYQNGQLLTPISGRGCERITIPCILNTYKQAIMSKMR